MYIKENMNLEYAFIAIMFPAIPLTMVMFGNRFHTTSVLIRQMHDEYIYEKVVPAEFSKQLKILKSRIILLKKSSNCNEFKFFYLICSQFLHYFLMQYFPLNSFLLYVCYQLLWR